jgi:hypothetical protein
MFKVLVPRVPKENLQEQDPANIKAAELMGKLHDRIEEIGYEDTC